MPEWLEQLVQQRRAFAKTALWLSDRMEGALSVCRRALPCPALTIAILLVPVTVFAQRLPRDNLLLYRSAEGRVQRVTEVADWQLRRESIVAAMGSIMGDWPGVERRCDLDVRLIEEVDCGNYLRRLIEYDSEPGSTVPAFLAIPKLALESEQPVPAVLCLHPTDNVHGHRVVHGLGGRANRQYAAELAERGFVTLAPAYPLLADYQPDLARLGYASGTMKAIWDNHRAIDLLQSLPFVDGARIAAIGHSLGGHNAVYTAVLEPRIRAVVSSCGLDSYVDYKDGDIRGWTSDRYMPRLLEYRDRVEAIPFDFHELIAALAPRHCLILAPVADDNFKADSVDRVAAAARDIYRLHDVESRLRVEHPDCGHDFPTQWRMEAYRFLEEALSCPDTSS